MSLRIVRKSRDAYVKLGFSLSALGMVAFAIPTFHREGAIPLVFAIGGLGLSMIVFIWHLKAILVPFEWELVVENDGIRWGRADHPKRQQHLNIAQVVRLIDGKSDCGISADIGGQQSMPVGDGILIRVEDRVLLVDYLRQNYPRLKIEEA